MPQIEHTYSGQEHGQNFAYYASDDEFLCDQTQFDALTYAEWLNAHYTMEVE